MHAGPEEEMAVSCYMRAGGKGKVIKREILVYHK